jgi:tRNA (cmo5U34)-methyltransferase
MAPAGGRAADRAEFDREASTYDASVRETMPAYSELHQMLFWGIPFLPTRGFRILELGVGTGTLSALLLEAFPQATLTGIDLSPRMIDISRRKLRPWRDRVTLTTGDLADFDDGEPFDVVVSALAIHHLSDPKKRQLFRKIARALSPGGYFGDGDDHLPEDPQFDARFAQVAATLGPPDGARGSAPRSPQRVWHAHERFDRPWTVAKELDALAAAGFRRVGVPWRFFAQAVVWAYL